jgi:protease-4
MVTGRSGRDLLEGAVMGDQTVVAQLERAFRDRRVRAVVLRVDSPGGSGAAAHLIDRAVQRLRRETGKPLVVSMASAAASAAYHMSVHADWIVANRHTRTGSIGVYWLKPALEGLYERLGVRQQEFDRGDAMRGWSYARRWTPAEQAGADSSIRRMHDRFVATVAHGRRLGVAEVDAVAQGRVWLGDDALRHGLVDQVGGLEEAVAEARRRAGIPPGERIALRMYGRPRPGLVERLLADALQSRLGGDLRFSALTGPQARADLGALGED